MAVISRKIMILILGSMHIIGLGGSRRKASLVNNVGNVRVCSSSCRDERFKDAVTVFSLQIFLDYWETWVHFLRSILDLMGSVV